jgi:hypothetical protein
MKRTLAIEKVVNKAKISDKKTDSAYWRTLSYSARLAALEEIRQEYHRWRYGGETKMKKVAKLIQLDTK